MGEESSLKAKLSQNDEISISYGSNVTFPNSLKQDLIKKLIELSDFEAAKDQLIRLKQVDAPHKEKLLTIATVIKEDKPFIVEGEFIPKSLGSGFVKPFTFPKGMDVFINKTILSRINLERGNRVRIQLAINGIGLIAQTLEPS